MKKFVFINDDQNDLMLMKYLLHGKNYFSTTTYTMYGSLVLDYIEEHITQPDKLPDVIILRTDTPAFSGWDFLDRFETLSGQIDKKIKLHVLTPCPNEEYTG